MITTISRKEKSGQLTIEPKTDKEVFWGEIAPSEHVLQIYEDGEVFLDSLDEFVSGGIRAGDGVIVIATAPHLEALENRLKSRGLDVEAARRDDRFIPLEAESVLAKFMVKGWPDEILFKNVILDLLARARKNGRRVRSFGEMVAVLWSRGDSGATVRLEHIWNQFCQSEMFCLFCAYPKSGFTQNANESIREICASHSRMIDG